MTIRIMIAVFFASLLSACGFHLRGDIPLAPPLKRLYVKSVDPYGTITKELEQSLRLSDVKLADQESNAQTVLYIKHENTAQDLLSVGGTQQTRQYRLRLDVTFEVTDTKGTVLVPAQTLEESRVITVQANQILGSSNEANLFFQQMRHIIASTIMYRLASPEVTRVINQAFTPPKPQHRTSS